jgi:predicted transcriptional regulator
MSAGATYNDPTGHRKLAGWKKLKLIRELALTGRTQVDLAEEFEVSQPTISYFASKHAAEIAEIRANAEDDFAGLWIAKKKNRLAEYQKDVDEVNELPPDPALKRIKHNALKSVAEELGALKTNVDATITYKVEGVDTEKLR